MILKNSKLNDDKDEKVDYSSLTESSDKNGFDYSTLIEPEDRKPKLNPPINKARQKLYNAADRAGLSREVADDFYNVVYGIESGASHYWKNGKVKESPVDPKDGQRAVGFSQIKPGTIAKWNKQAGRNLDPYNEDDNILGGLLEFNSIDPNDPVARRIGYFAGGASKALAYYRRTGKIPKGGDFTGTSFDTYIKKSQGDAPQTQKATTPKTKSFDYSTLIEPEDRKDEALTPPTPVLPPLRRPELPTPAPTQLDESLRPVSSSPEEYKRGVAAEKKQKKEIADFAKNLRVTGTPEQIADLYYRNQAGQPEAVEYVKKRQDELKTQTAQPQKTQPAQASRPVSITGEDLRWHLGMNDPNEIRNWSPRLRNKAIRIVTAAVEEDKRKRAELIKQGKPAEIPPPPLSYQNEMRRKVGIPELTNQVNRKPSVSDFKPLNIGAGQVVNRMNRNIEEIKSEPITPISANDEKAAFNELVKRKLQELKEEEAGNIRATQSDPMVTRSGISIPAGRSEFELAKIAEQQVREELAGKSASIQLKELQFAEQQEQERAARVAQLPAYQQITDAMGRVIKPIFQTPGNFAQYGAIAQNSPDPITSGIRNVLNAIPGYKELNPTKDADESLLYQFGKAWNESVDTHFFKNLGAMSKDLDPEFRSKLFEGAGSMAKYMGLTAAGGAPLMLLGAAADQVPQIYNEAKAKGYPEEKANALALLLGTGLAFTELIPIERALNRAVKGDHSKFLTRLIHGTVSGGEEFIQEGGQQAIQDVTAKLTYDPKRKLSLKTWAEAGLIGFITGGAVGVVLGGSQSDKDIEKAKQDFEDKLAALDAVNRVRANQGKEPIIVPRELVENIRNILTTPKEVRVIKNAAQAQPATANVPPQSERAPETALTIKEQANVARDENQPRVGVIIPEGQEKPTGMSGLVPVKVDDVTVYFNPKKATRQEVIDLVRSGNSNQIIGAVEPEGVARASENPQIVTGRDAQGQEQSSRVVSAENAPAQEQITAQESPTVETKPLAQAEPEIVNERLNAPGTAVSSIAEAEKQKAISQSPQVIPSFTPSSLSFGKAEKARPIEKVSLEAGLKPRAETVEVQSPKSKVQSQESGQNAEIPDTVKPATVKESTDSQEISQGQKNGQVAAITKGDTYRNKATGEVVEVRRVDDKKVIVGERGNAKVKGQIVKRGEFESGFEPAAQPEAEKANENNKLTQLADNLAVANGRRPLHNLSGGKYKKIRARILSDLLGENVPVSQAGVNRLQQEVYNTVGITGDTAAEKEDNYIKWLTETFEGGTKVESKPQTESDQTKHSEESEENIVNPIDRTATQGEKADMLRALSDKNVPIVTEILGDITGLGLESKYSHKERQKVIDKANRPSIKEKKPWFDVEHIRDSLRFKASLNKFEDILKIAEFIQSKGIEIIKVDTSKMIEPKEWGWRFVALDLRMPNGQLVEFYAPPFELDQKGVKDINHDLFEKWRQATPEELQANREEYEIDVTDSYNRYQDAYLKAIERMGYKDEAAAAASWNKISASLSSLTGIKKSLSSSAVIAPLDQLPDPSRTIAKGSTSSLPPGKTKTLPESGSRETLITSSTESISQPSAKETTKTDETKLPEKETEYWKVPFNQFAKVESVLTPYGKYPYHLAPSPAFDVRLEEKGEGEPKGFKTFESLEKWVNETHEKIVRKAIREGKDVPQEVLADYPELVKPIDKGRTIQKEGESDVIHKRPSETAQKTEEGLAASGDDSKTALGEELPGVSEKPQSRKSGERHSVSPSGGVSGTVSQSGGRRDEPVASETDSGERDTSATESGKRLTNKPLKDADAVKRDVVTTGNFYIDDIETFAAGSLKQKFRANVEAIKTLRQIQSEGRATATPEEQTKLAKYIGWGQFPALFNTYNRAGESWDRERDELLELVTKEEYEAAEASTKNAHYTAPQIVDAVWQIVRNLGFTGGRVLETSVGTGNFFMMMPKELRTEVKATGIELDVLTAQIAKLLFPKYDIQQRGYETFRPPKGFYDLAISNVPFGKYAVSDTKMPYFLKKYIHNYFFAKALDDVRPGGLIAFITSTGTLNSKEVLEYLSGRADLVTAMRFPSDTFLKNAGTAVVTDLIVLRVKNPQLPAQLRKELDELLDTATYVDQSLAENQRKLRGMKTENPNFAALNQKVTNLQLRKESLNQQIDELRKTLDEQKRFDSTNWTEIGTVPDPDGGDDIPINQYYIDNPRNLLGRLDRSGTMYRGGSVNLTRKPDFESHLRDLIQNAPKNVYIEAQSELAQMETRQEAPEEMRQGSILIKEGQVFTKEGTVLNPVPMKKSDIENLTKVLAIRDALNDTLNFEREGNVKEANQTRKKLNELYDKYVAEHGTLHKNKVLIAADPDHYRLLALENYDGKTKTVTGKSDVFTKTTVSPVERATTAKSHSDAVSISLNETGKISLERVAGLLGTTQEQVAIELVEQGIAFNDPRDGWQLRDIYLSGEVKRKLAEAIEAARLDQAFVPNVEALREVQPADIAYRDITPTIGAAWIPASDIAEFMADISRDAGDSMVDADDFIVQKLATGDWVVGYSSSARNTNSSVQKEILGTPDRPLPEIVQAVIKDIPISITYKGEVDVKQTARANKKAQVIKAKFKAWVWKDDARRERLHRAYNDTYNNVTKTKYDGSHITFDGMAKEFEGRPFVMRQMQKDSIYRAIVEGRILAAHEVGTGKTSTMIALAMELRRLKLAKKPAIICLNANVQQIAETARALYPQAKILSAYDSMDAKTRKQTTTRLMTGDWDMVILTHENLEKIPMSKQSKAAFINEELQYLRDQLAQEIANDEAADTTSSWRRNKKKNNDNRVVKALMAKIANKQAKLSDILSKPKDDAMTFEESGIDFLMVDEAHAFKNLEIYTTRMRTKGIPTSEADRAMNLYMMTRWLTQNNNGRGIGFFTGTPISNTIAEVYNMQRYLMYDDLKSRDIQHFDAWAANYGENIEVSEMSASGEYKQVTAFRAFKNLETLSGILNRVMDTAFAEDVPEIKRPKRIDEVIKAPMSKGQRAYLETIKARSDALKRRGGARMQKGEDNWLALGTHAKWMAIDLRLVDPKAKDDPRSKANALVKKVLELHKENPGKVQLIFSDVGVNPTKMNPDFNLYQDIINKLVAGGIPRSKIINFSKFSSKGSLKKTKGEDTSDDGASPAKDEAMRRLNDGDALIAIGSTQKLGTGVNVQKRAIAAHKLDVKHRPDMDEQEIGRVWRHGNSNEQVYVIRYTTEDSFDMHFYDRLKQKKQFIDDIMRGRIKGSYVTDLDDSLDYDTVVAVTASDPRLKERMDVLRELQTVELDAATHEEDQLRLRDSKNRLESSIRYAQRTIKEREQDKRYLEENQNNRTVKIGDETFEAEDMDALTARDLEIEEIRSKVREEMPVIVTEEKSLNDGLREQEQETQRRVKELPDLEADKVRKLLQKQVDALKQRLRNSFSFRDEFFTRTWGGENTGKSEPLALFAGMAIKTTITEVKGSYKSNLFLEFPSGEEASIYASNPIQSAYHAIENRKHQGTARLENEIEENRKQIENLAKQIGVPFEDEGKLKELKSKLARLEIEMGMASSIPDGYESVKARVGDILSKGIPDDDRLSWVTGTLTNGKIVSLAGNGRHAILDYLKEGDNVSSIPEYSRDNLTRRLKNTMENAPNSVKGKPLAPVVVESESDLVVFDNERGVDAEVFAEVEKLHPDALYYAHGEWVIAFAKNRVVAVLDAERIVDGLPEELMPAIRSARYSVEQRQRDAEESRKVPDRDFPSAEFLNKKAQGQLTELAQASDSDFPSESLKMARTPDAEKAIDALADVDTDSLLKDAVVTRDGDVISLNGQSYELVRRALNDVKLAKGESLESIRNEAPFDGLFLRPKDELGRSELPALIKVMERAAQKAQEYNYTKAEVDVFRNIADELKAAQTEGQGTAILKVFDDALIHESFHQGSYLGAGGKLLDERHSIENLDRLYEMPATKAWLRKYGHVAEYQRATKGLIVEETAATIADGTYEEIGISEQEAVDYMTAWATSYVEQNSPRAILNFRRTRTDVKQILEKARAGFEAATENVRTDEQSGSRARQSDNDRGKVQRRPKDERRDDTQTSSGTKEEVATRDADGKMRRRSLPETLREQGLSAADELYFVYGNKQASADAKKLLTDLGFDGAVELLRTVENPGAQHVHLSKIIQRAYMKTAEAVAQDNPTLAAQLRQRQLDLASDLAARMTRAGQFIQAAQVLEDSVEGIIATAQKLAKSQGRDLSEKELKSFQEKGEDLERTVAETQAAEAELSRIRRAIDRARKLSANLQNRIRTREKRLEDLPETVRRRNRKTPESHEQLRKSAQKIVTKNQSLDEIEAAIKALMGGDNLISGDNLIKSARTQRTVSQAINSREWWHVPPRDKDAYAKRGKFYSSSFKEAEFYGIKSNATPERVNVNNPLIGDEEFIEKTLLGETPSQSLPGPDAEGFYDERIGLDERLAKAAMEKGYDAIALVTTKGFESYQETGKLPKSVELNTFNETDGAMLKMARVATDEATQLNEETLAQLSNYGAAILLQGKLSDITVTDFKEKIRDTFGDSVEPYLDQIHAESLSKRRDAVRRARFENLIERIAQEEGNEDLSYDELQDLAYEKLELDRRLRDLTNEHGRAERKYKRSTPEAARERLEKQKEKALKPRKSIPSRKQAGPSITGLMRAIAKEADRFVRIAAANLADPEMTIGEFTRRMKEEYGIQDVKQIREYFKRGNEALTRARREIAAEGDKQAAAKQMLADLKLSEAEALKQVYNARRSRQKARQEIQNEFRKTKARTNFYTKGVHVGATAFDVTRSVTTSLMASMDLSGIGRQGGIGIAMKPALAPQFIKNTVQSYSKAGFAANMDFIENHPIFSESQSAGVNYAFAGDTAEHDKGEELFSGGQYLERIPKVGKYLAYPIERSDESYGGGLDRLRLDLYGSWSAVLKDAGLKPSIDKEAFKGVADWVNIITGRGVVKPDSGALTQATYRLLNITSFAPKYRLSRLQFLTAPFNPTFHRLPTEARRLIFKSWARYMGTMGLTLGTLAVFGAATGLASVSFADPDDDEWLKVKIGNTKLDLSSGLQPQARFMLRLMADVYKSPAGMPAEWLQNKLPSSVQAYLPAANSQTGAETTISATNAALSWARGGANPVLSLFADWFTGKTYTGRQFEWTGWEGALATRLLPLNVSNLAQNTQKFGVATALAAFVPEFVGVNASTYAQTREKPKTKAEKLALKLVGYKSNKIKAGRTDEEDEVQKQVFELTQRSRKGEDVKAEVNKLVKDGKIKEDRAKDIIDAKKFTFLQQLTKRLTIPEAVRVFRLSNSNEKDDVLDIIEEKIESKREKDGLSPEDKEALQQIELEQIKSFDKKKRLTPIKKAKKPERPKQDVDYFKRKEVSPQ